MDTFRVPLTVGAAVDTAARVLAATSPTPRLDAQVLVRHAARLSAAETIAHADRLLPTETISALAQLVEHRCLGEPIAYLTGRREFWSLDLHVSPATLIPRPETELLVERALVHIPFSADWAIADLGTGSGAVALALARERPRVAVVATDRSDAALAVARSNAQRLGITNVEFRQGNWFAPLRGRRFRLVLSNPPYVRTDDPHLRDGDVRFEPRDALVGGADGLDALRQIAGAAGEHMEHDGWLLLEHGFDQAAAVRALLAANGFRHVRSHLDLAGHARITEGQRV